MLFFTLCNINQLPQAHLLGDSIRQHQPDADFFIGLIDKKDRIPDDFEVAYKVIEVSEIDIPHFDSMTERYLVSELLPDCKPFFVDYALKSSDKVIYLDCTSVLFSSVDFLENDLSHYNIILVPQLLHVGVHPDEKQILNTGIFHSGFIGFRRSEETHRFLQWWSKSTAEKGYVDLCKGLNTDQLWLEFVPAFYDKVLIQKHEGLNVGIWSLPERKIDSAKNTVNGQPLISVNFKGMKYWRAYRKKLRKNPIKKTEPFYGIPDPKENKIGKGIARNIRKINGLVDKLIDLIQ